MSSLVIKIASLSINAGTPKATEDRQQARRDRQAQQKQ
jgi:hypothetical protein